EAHNFGLDGGPDAGGDDGSRRPRHGAADQGGDEDRGEGKEQRRGEGQGEGRGEKGSSAERRLLCRCLGSRASCWHPSDRWRAGSPQGYPPEV
ncbi:MAG: hypothetical protein AVDCRST_MAG37-3499, partial [uncultured Rubrobacteraceae bacterium]